MKKCVLVLAGDHQVQVAFQHLFGVDFTDIEFGYAPSLPELQSAASPGYQVRAYLNATGTLSRAFFAGHSYRVLGAVAPYGRVNFVCFDEPPDMPKIVPTYSFVANPVFGQPPPAYKGDGHFNAYTRIRISTASRPSAIVADGSIFALWEQVKEAKDVDDVLLLEAADTVPDPSNQNMRTFPEKVRAIDLRSGLEGFVLGQRFQNQSLTLGEAAKSGAAGDVQDGIRAAALALLRGAGQSDKPDEQIDTNYLQAISQATSLTTSGDRQGAMEVLKEAIRRKPNVPYGHLYLGICYVGMGDQKSATEEYNTLLGLKKDELAASLLQIIRSKFPE